MSEDGKSYTTNPLRSQEISSYCSQTTWPRSRPAGASKLAEQPPVDPRQDLGQILRDQPRTGLVARLAMQPDRRAAASKPGMPWARQPAANPASTSPDPAVASQGGALSAIAARPSGAATTVSGPFSSTIAPDARPRCSLLKFRAKMFRSLH